MDWKSEAKAVLRAYPRKKNAVNSLATQISQLRMDAESIHSATSDGTPVSGGGNRREENLLNNLVMRGELERNRAATVQWCANVERALDTLQREDRLVLDRMYIHRQRGHVERLCEELHIEKTTAYRRADAALFNFIQAYYGVSEF